jgi:hypothetical protein
VRCGHLARGRGDVDNAVIEDDDVVIGDPVLGTVDGGGSVGRTGEKWNGQGKGDEG